MRKLLGDKKGSMMLEYFIIMAVGILLLGAFVGFLGEGESLIKNSAKQYKKIATTDDSNLGSFK